jgi:hypothetical protein
MSVQGLLAYRSHVSTRGRKLGNAVIPCIIEGTESDERRKNTSGRPMRSSEILGVRLLGQKEGNLNHAGPPQIKTHYLNNLIFRKTHMQCSGCMYYISYIDPP